MNFDQKLQRLNREMIPHAVIGHPLASLLSLAGFKRAAEYVHYRTLPIRARRKIPRWKVLFDHSTELVWADVLFAPLSHVARAFGRYRLANRIFFRGPWEAALRHDTCNMTPDEQRWAESRYKELTGKSIYQTHGVHGRASIALAEMKEKVWSGQARGLSAPTAGKIDASVEPKSLFERLTAVKLTRRGMATIEHVIGVKVKHGTSAAALRAIILCLDFDKKQELERLISLAESGDNLDAKG